MTIYLVKSPARVGITGIRTPTSGQKYTMGIMGKCAKTLIKIIRMFASHLSP